MDLKNVICFCQDEAAIGILINDFDGIAVQTGAADNFIDGQIVEELKTKILMNSVMLIHLLVSSLILGQECLKTLVSFPWSYRVFVNNSIVIYHPPFLSIHLRLNQYQAVIGNIIANQLQSSIKNNLPTHSFPLKKLAQGRQ